MLIIFTSFGDFWVIANRTVQRLHITFANPLEF